MLNNSSLEEVLKVLLRLPKELVPIYFSHDEKKSSRRKIENTGFEEFKKKHRLGFLLYGKHCSYNIDLTGSDAIEITLFLDKGIQADLMLEYFSLLSKIDMYFGFACDEAEYEYRNRIESEIKGNHIQAWVGKNIDNYVSGIYWLTYISKKLREKLNIDVGMLCQQAINPSESEARELIQFYDLPDNWKVHRENLDALCDVVPGVFSKKNVLEKLKPVDDVIQFSEVIHGYR